MTRKHKFLSSNEDAVPSPQLPSYYISSHIVDSVMYDVQKRQFDSGKNIICDSLQIIATKKEWREYIKKQYNGFQNIQREHNGVFITKDDDMIYYYESDSYIVVQLYGNEEFVSNQHEQILTKFKIFGTYIKWYYNEKGEYIKVPLNTDKLPVEEMYPFLNGSSLHDYYDNFMNSSANILLLIGPPGTGKTSFIRGLLHHTQSSALVTYNLNILNSDSVFAEFIEDNEKFMVMEDADTYLEARTAGNTMMHRFLNVADGLVSSNNKKLIFSTNLSSTSDIDPALIRPGRCFDVLHFDPLTPEQAKKLADKLGIEDITDDEDCTIANIFNKSLLELKPNKPKMGFV